MSQAGNSDGAKRFLEALEALQSGSFSALEPAFTAAGDVVSAKGDAIPNCDIVEWFELGMFDNHPVAAAEALSCACFLGRTSAVAYLLRRGLDPNRGDRTWMNGVHWAVNRGNYEMVQLLLKHGIELERRNGHGTTALGTAVWSLLHEPSADHPAIVSALLQAGARRDSVSLPTGNATLDALLAS